MWQARAALLWSVPLLLHTADAYAWGLYTHMFFAQLLIWTVPLADPRFRRALQRFPELCLAATCLPDISLFGRGMRSAALRTTHQWSAALGMLRDASDDSDRAMALGYAGHLLADIVAHNYFVPAHERLWFRTPIVTHALSEWAMDAHVSGHVFVRPGALIAQHRETLATYAGARLGFSAATALRALGLLMHGELALRRSGLPRLAYSAARRADPGLTARFDDYVCKTSSRLAQVNRLIAGDVPAWLPEIEGSGEAPAAARRQSHAYYSLLLPVDFFRDSTSPDSTMMADKL